MTVIKIKNSNVAGRLPASGDLQVAELALNIQDKKLYSKDAAGTIFEIGAAGDLPSGDNPPNSGNNVGDLFYDTDNGQLLYWDGSGWQVISSEPADGEGYVKISGDNMTGDLTLGTDKITLDAGTGSAEFAAGVGFGGQALTGSMTAEGARITENGVIQLRRDGSTVECISVFGNGSSSGEKNVAIFNDGSATFAGDVTFPRGCVNGDIEPSARFCVKGAFKANTLSVFSNSNNVLGTETAKINADGSAEFADQVRIAGAFIVDTNLNATGNYKAFINPNDGSAIFAGNITAGNVSFNLANGSTLDVKDRLTKADNALKALKTAAALASDFATLKAAIATALTDI